jgi:hypothetical protein
MVECSTERKATDVQLSAVVNPYNIQKVDVHLSSHNALNRFLSPFVFHH